jgi:hypothetical protein
MVDNNMTSESTSSTPTHAIDLGKIGRGHQEMNPAEEEICLKVEDLNLFYWAKWLW